MLKAPRATALFSDETGDEDADGVEEPPALVMREKVVDASVASEDGEVMMAVELEKPVGAADVTAAELIVWLPPWTAPPAIMLPDGVEAELDADGVYASLEIPN